MAHNIDVLAQDAQHPHDNDVDDDDSGVGQVGSLKRKASNDGRSQQRARRNRYVSIACNECKRRKIKCNGQTPCTRCGNLNLDCVYAPNGCSGFKDSPEWRDMTQQIVELQEKVHTLFEGLSALRAHLDQRSLPMQSQQLPLDPAMKSTPPASTHNGNINPHEGTTTSTSHQDHPTYTYSRPHSLPTDEQQRADSALSNPPLPNIDSTFNRQLLPTVHPTKDPIWSISHSEALRLCRLYDDEMSLMYPVMDMAKLYPYISRLYRFIEAAYKSGLMQQGMPGPDALDDVDTNILKMTLALALTVETPGRSVTAHRLYEAVQSSLDKTLIRGTINIKTIRLLTLTAIYEFHLDNEGTSWRIIGLACRLCIETGLHRKATYDSMPDEAARTETRLMFWAIYTMDRRWSVGTGMPFALQDSDIDPNLPRPDDRSPYLSALVQFAAYARDALRASAKSVSSPNNPTLDIASMEHMEQQFVHWHRSLPHNLRYDSHPSPDNPLPCRAVQRLRVILLLRANQMRIIIYRPVLNSPTTILRYPRQARSVVDIAKDTIRLLTTIHQTTDLFTTQQALFNTFLTGALAILFLAVSHAPAVFAPDVRPEFHMALALVRGLSEGSFVSVRLWKTIQGLKDLGHRLRANATATATATATVNPPPPAPSPSHSAAAIAMADLSRHPNPPPPDTTTTPFFPPWPLPTPDPPLLPSSTDPAQPNLMADDLSQMFAAVGGELDRPDLLLSDHELGLFYSRNPDALVSPQSAGGWAENGFAPGAGTGNGTGTGTGSGTGTGKGLAPAALVGPAAGGLVGMAGEEGLAEVLSELF